MPMMKVIGKPYAGKPHVRIDEGAGKAAMSSRSTLLAIKLFFGVDSNFKFLAKKIIK